MAKKEKNAVTLTAIQKVVETVVDDKMDIIRDEFKRRFDEVLTGNDRVVKKLDTIQTEIAAWHGGQRRQDDHLHDHENRLRHLEAHSRA